MMNKLEDVISLAKISDFLQKKDADNEREEKREQPLLLLVLLPDL